ncbi:MAG TPA: HlyD family type I secretion periplasmic adaptor subunit [Rhizomicrobium sp.]
METLRSLPRRAWMQTAALAGRIWRGVDGAVEALVSGRRADAGGRPAIHDFKSEVSAIEEAPVPVSAFAALYAVVALIVTAIVWSLIGTIDRIVIAQGKLVTTAPMIVMQPFTTARILKIYAKAGDRVHKNELLVSFDPAFAKADQLSLEQKNRALAAEHDRILAELSGQGTFDMGADPSPERLAEAKLFTQRQAQFHAELAVRDSRRQQIEAQLAASQASVVGMTKQLDLAHKVADIWRRLQAAQAGSPLQLMVAEKDEVDAGVRLKTAIEESIRLKGQRTEAVADRQSYLQQWQSDLSQKLAEITVEAAQATEDLKKARKLSDLTEMRAPVDAVVLQLADVSEGSVLREAETLITLVPDDAKLRLDANIESRDVGFVSVGDPVRVKFEAYPFQRYGTLLGRLDVVSPDSLDVKEGDASRVVFRAEVQLKETAGRIAGLGIRLRPGLVATAEIKAGERTIASYVLDPIVKTSREAMREP